MALINRLSRLVRADFHAVLDQIEEPELLLRQAIRDMDDELTAAEQRLAGSVRNRDRLASRGDTLRTELGAADEQLDLCFASNEDELARKLIRRKLETERSLKRLDEEHAACIASIDEQETALADHRDTLQSLQQKAAIVVDRFPAECGSRGRDDTGWAGREGCVSDDEVEIAFLSEKQRRAAS